MNGGDGIAGTSYSGGGGGGRIALYADTSDFHGAVEAFGGKTNVADARLSDGAPGTIFIEHRFALLPGDREDLNRTLTVAPASDRPTADLPCTLLSGAEMLLLDTLVLHAGVKLCLHGSYGLQVVTVVGSGSVTASGGALWWDDPLQSISSDITLSLASARRFGFALDVPLAGSYLGSGNITGHSTGLPVVEALLGLEVAQTSPTLPCTATPDATGWRFECRANPGIPLHRAPLHLLVDEASPVMVRSYRAYQFLVSGGA